MGKGDELEQELEREAALRASREAVKGAVRGVVETVEGLADGMLGYAERRLAAAEAARGKGPPLPPVEASERALESVRRAAPTPTVEAVHQRRAAREERARIELEALKRARAEGPVDPEPAPRSLDELPPRDEPPPEVRPGEDARVRRARVELAALKRGPVPPPREEPVGLGVPRSLEAADPPAPPAQPEDRPPAKRTL